MSDELRDYCTRVAQAADEVLLALVAPAPPRRRRELQVPGTPEVESWLSRLGGDLRHLGALGNASDDD